MDFRKAPGEVLERIWWNGEKFVLERSGKAVACIIGFADFKAFLLSLHQSLPFGIPCNSCIVTIEGDGTAKHESFCPTESIYRMLKAIDSQGGDAT